MCAPNGLRYLRVVAGAGKTVREAEDHHTSGARDVMPPAGYARHKSGRNHLSFLQDVPRNFQCNHLAYGDRPSIFDI